MVYGSVFRSMQVALLGLFASSALGACGSDVGGSDAGGAGGAPATSGAAGSAARSAGSGGVAAVAGAPAGAGALSAAGSTISVAGIAGTGSGGWAAGAASAGAPNVDGGASAGTSGGASAGSGGVSAGGGGVSAGGGSGAAPPSECNLPTPVSFQKNIQGFLTTSCGKAVGGGCHVTDTSKTSLGYDHAYDWITAVAHTGSCGKTQPYVKRFEVVLALIAGAKPSSCPNSRQMPPNGMGTPLTVCQVAALQAWLAEPMVSQMHVPVTDDTKDLYPAGAYLMPPFN